MYLVIHIFSIFSLPDVNNYLVFSSVSSLKYLRLLSPSNFPYLKVVYNTPLFLIPSLFFQLLLVFSYSIHELKFHIPIGIKFILIVYFLESYFLTSYPMVLLLTYILLDHLSLNHSLHLIYSTLIYYSFTISHIYPFIIL